MSKPIKLTSPDGKRTTTVKNPTTVTNLRAQGWKPAKESKAPAAFTQPSDKGGK